MHRLLLASLTTAVLGCGAPDAAPKPDLATWTAPPDWVTVSNDRGDLQLTLPPWLEVFDNHGAIFANMRPVRPGGPIPIQLWAQGPTGVEEQPLPGEDLARWVERRLDNPAAGVPTVTRVLLPAGAGIRYDRIDLDATGWAWRIVVFGLETPAGAAWLQLDGPPEEWATRADDLERVALLFRAR